MKRFLIFLFVSVLVHLSFFLFTQIHKKEINGKLNTVFVSFNSGTNTKSVKKTYNTNRGTKSQKTYANSSGLKSVDKGIKNAYVQGIIGSISSRLNNSILARRGIKGKVMLELSLDADGTVIKKQILSSNNSLIASIVLESILPKYQASPDKTDTVIKTTIVFK